MARIEIFDLGDQRLIDASIQTMSQIKGGGWTPPPSAAIQTINALYAIGQTDVANQAVNTLNDGGTLLVNVVIDQGGNVVIQNNNP